MIRRDLLLLAVGAAVIAAVALALLWDVRVAGVTPSAYSPVPPSAFRGYVVPTEDKRPDPTHPRSATVRATQPERLCGLADGDAVRLGIPAVCVSVGAPPSPSLVARPHASPRATREAPRSTRGHRVTVTAISGVATYYSVGPGFYAAAGPALRHGNWRGTVVSVTANGHTVRVRLVDWCACGPRHGRPTLLDLSRDAFAALTDPSVGVLRVVVGRP